MRTDADGRFGLSFPREQVAEPRLTIMVRVKHPGFIARRSLRVPLAEIIRGRARGEEPFFSTIRLESGVEYTARVVTPAGKPAAAIPYLFENWEWGTNPSRHFTNDLEGETDDQGRIDVRMPKSHSVSLYVGPPRSARARFPFAPYRHFWGTDDPSGHPDVWAPTDLGRIVLARGIRVSGRLLDTEGRPIAGQTIRADPLRGPDVHLAVTEADGSFSLGPLRLANYVIQGERQNAGGGIDPDIPPLPGPIRVIRPVWVYLKEGVAPEPLVLREMPSIRVEVAFVDFEGKTGSRRRGDIVGNHPERSSPGQSPGCPHQGEQAGLGDQ